MVSAVATPLISIHALLAESDSCRCQPHFAQDVFLSTLSLRRATPAPPLYKRHELDFYPRSPCGERPVRFAAGLVGIVISIHALLAESDLLAQHQLEDENIFLSTLSLRRATRKCAPSYNPNIISIHALLAESDPAIDVFLAVWAVISIHALLAESDSKNAAIGKPTLISIHALLAESDLLWRRQKLKISISIHALLAESDYFCGPAL